MVTVCLGTIKIDDIEYTVNHEFQQETLQVADALNVDEILAADYYMQAQPEAKKLDRSNVMSTIIRFHERRAFLLESLRLVFHESFEVEREETQALMQEVVARVLEIQNGPLRNGSLFARKCMDSMSDIEKWLALLGEQIQKASIIGESEESELLEIIEYQRHSLDKQHESLAAILCYLFKGTFTSSEDLRRLLEKLRKIEKLDLLLVHYIPAIVSSVTQYGSPEGSGSLRDARSLHQTIISSKEPENWAFPNFHAATIALWLAEYTGWYFEPGQSSPLQGVNPETEAAALSKTFMTALDDGAFEFILAICAGITQSEDRDPARNELVSLLLKDSVVLTVEPDYPSPYFYSLLMEHIEVFAESLIANMPDTVRMLKSEEDLKRLDQITALREGLAPSLHHGPIEARMHFEAYLIMFAFSFEHRLEAAQDFWGDPDGNLYGFLQWASKRQTVPRVSAFCEMLCSISEGEENSSSAHKFLMDEDRFSSGKSRKSASMNWSQMFSELHLYAVRVTERPSTTQPSILRLRKPEPVDVDEPESPVMLTSYLRLISHLCRQNPQVRTWVLQHPNFNLINTLLTLCNATIPSHLRASIFVTLRSLVTDRTSALGNELWVSLDQWISGSGSQAMAFSKMPLVSNSPLWNERQAFQKITETFDQTNSFVQLLVTLVSPTTDSIDTQLFLPFPESLGSSYRMPGIEPYIDFVMGQAFATKSMALQGTDASALQWNCLDFAAHCLESFNDNLVHIINQPSMSIDSSLKSSALSTYVRLHPFSRIIEWLFNNDVLKAVFSAAHQDIDAVARASSNSVLLRSLLRSIDIMNLILEHQPNYFDIVRPLLKAQYSQGSSNVASTSLASFEDSVLGNLSLITDLCLYCGTGHPQLTLASLALLEKLSSSRKLNKSSLPAPSRWQSANQIVELLNIDVAADRIARCLVPQMRPDVRELESGPNSSGYLIKEGLLSLLDRCLQTLDDKPNMAHLLLGFSCLGSALDVTAGSLFDNQMSLLHTIVEFVVSFPEGVDSAVVSWMVHIKRLAFQVLQHLWSSNLASTLVLPELRSSQLVTSLFISQPLVVQQTLWDSFQIGEPEFWYSESAEALSEFLAYRSLLFDYAVTELRAVCVQASPSLQKELLSTLFGNSVDVNNKTVSHPSIFDLFDFADLDISGSYPFPELRFFNDLDIDLCASSLDDDSPVLYDIPSVNELIELRKGDLLRAGQVSQQDEEQLLADRDKLLLFLRATNQSRNVALQRHLALRSWAELTTTIFVSCDIEPGPKIMFGLQVLQIALPKLESSIVDNVAEAAELARLAESIVGGISSGSAGQDHSSDGDMIDERLYHLFQTCVHGIPLVSAHAALRESLYNICSQYLFRLTGQNSTHKRSKAFAYQAVKISGPALMEVVCDDAYSGQESCRLAALLLLNLLSVFDRQQNSSLIIDLISQSNYLSMFVDIVRAMPLEFRDAPAGGM